MPSPSAHLEIAAERGLAIPAGGMRLSGLARLAMAWSDALSRADLESARRRSLPISCAKGCGACCRELIPISPAEAFALAEYLDALDVGASGPLPPHSGTRERLAAVNESLRLASADNPWLWHDPRGYFALQLACPFLEEESCSIHPERPLVCREHLVISPARHCGSFPDLAINVLDLSHPVSEALARACGILLGRAPERIPLVSAPEWAAGNAEEGRREWPAEILAGTLASQLFSR